MSGQAAVLPGTARSRSTSRSLWIYAFVLGVGLFALRLPKITGYVDSMLADNPDIIKGLRDGSTRELAINIGIGLSIIASAGIIFLYQSLARMLELHVFTPSRRVLGARRVGLFFLVAVACTVPVSTYCAFNGSLRMTGNVWLYLYVLGVGIVAPFAFRSHWRGLNTGRVAGIFGASIAFGILSTLI